MSSTVHYPMPERRLIPIDEIPLVDLLETMIEEGKKDKDYLLIALKLLSDTRNTFSLYDTYMEKIGLMIE